MSLRAKIEAVLYMTDKPLRAQAIAGIVGEELQLVRQTLLDLIHEYEERQGGLEIADEDGYSFQVRDQFANLMDQFMPIEMTAALLRTLSAIAIKQPIPQSEIIRIRGAGAYEHIKELVVRGLVSKREDEKTRSPLLSTTKQFQEYFRLTKDGKSLRQYLKREMKKKDKEDLVAAEPSLTEDMSPEPIAAEPIIAETIAAPITTAPITAAPITTAPITAAPITAAPITTAPITAAPITAAPITAAPITAAPITAAPITAAAIAADLVATEPKASEQTANETLSFAPDRDLTSTLTSDTISQQFPAGTTETGSQSDRGGDHTKTAATDMTPPKGSEVSEDNSAPVPTTPASLSFEPIDISSTDSLN